MQFSQRAEAVLWLPYLLPADLFEGHQLKCLSFPGIQGQDETFSGSHCEKFRKLFFIKTFGSSILQRKSIKRIGDSAALLIFAFPGYIMSRRNNGKKPVSHGGEPGMQLSSVQMSGRSPFSMVYIIQPACCRQQADKTAMDPP